MLKIIFTLSIIVLLNITTVFAQDEKKSNGVLFYEQCNILLKKSEKKNISDLGENLCIFIKNNNSEIYSILAKKENNFGLEIINEKTIKYLKKNYYRGEKININLVGYKKIILNSLKFQEKYFTKYNTLDSNYKINFLEDNLLKNNLLNNTSKENFNILIKNCKFNSYYPTCTDINKNLISKKINEKLLTVLFTKEKLLKSSKNILENEQIKNNKIKNKIIYLDKYYSEKQKKSEEIIYSENIKFTISFIIYKLEIYNKILENRIGDLEFNEFLKKNNIYFIDKKLIGDLYISQNDQFTFFYYGNKRINTLKNSISHFDLDELELDSKLKQENLEYLKQKIREKYSARYVINSNKKLILITKKYLSKEKYLLFNTNNYSFKEIFDISEY